MMDEITIEGLFKCEKCNTEYPLSEIISKSVTDKIKEQLRQKYQSYKESDRDKIFQKAKNEARIEAKNEYNQQINKLNNQLSQLIENNKDLTNQISDLIKGNNFKDQEKLNLLGTIRNLKSERENFDLKVLEKANKLVEDEVQKARKEEKHLAMEIIQKKDEQIKRTEEKLKEGLSKTGSVSSKLLGDIKESEVTEVLSYKFPKDKIIKIKPGQPGGDIIQEVFDDLGQNCGKILWESKNAATWNNVWIEKCKKDQRDIQAFFGIIISKVLPKDFDHFGISDDIWFCDFETFLNLSILFRNQIIEINRINKSIVGLKDKKEILYNYIRNEGFKQKVLTIIDSYKSLKDDLENEKKYLRKKWSDREDYIESVISSTQEMYYDLQRLMGSESPAIIELLESEDIRTQEIPELKENRY